MFSIGSTIRDPKGDEWLVTSTWTFKDYLCLALIGIVNTSTQGKMGGARFKSGDAVYIKS